jgi:hypothetical protein
MPPLENPREELVAQGLAMGKSQVNSCKEAGYSGNRGNSSTHANKQSISKRVKEIQQERLDKFTLTPAWVTERLVENVNRAMQIDAPRDADGNIIGSFKYQGNVANRALELLAKTLGMLIEKSDVTQKRDYADLSNLELVKLLARARELELLEHTGQVIDAEALD